MKIDVWSDIMCPWCAVGFGNLMQAVDEYGSDVEVTWHSFELDSHAPKVIDGDYVDALAKKYSKTREDAQQWVDLMASRGAEVGIQFDFSKLRPGNTLDAHRLLHLAGKHNLQTALKERLLRACFEEGQAIGQRATLKNSALQVGLPEQEVDEVLDSNRYEDEVRADQKVASSLNITGVPFFVIDQRLGLSGAQPPSTLLAALRQASADATEAHSCSIDGDCA